MKAPAHAPWQWCLAGLAAALLAAGALVLYWFDPVTAGFYPICPFHAVTGLECPGCGTLRALHALAHGHLAAAWHFNAFLVLCLPALGWLAVREAVRWTSGWQLPGIVTRPVFGWLAAAGMVVWGVARNLPVFCR